MQFDQLPSGIIVPHEPPKPAKVEPPTIDYGPIELRDPDAKKATYKALGSVWVATGLNYYSSIRLPDTESRDVHDARKEAFHKFAKALLGTDYCGFGELC